MKTKYTKGEWTIDWFKGVGFNIPMNICVQTILEGGVYKEVICDILHGAENDKEYIKHFKEETEANAKLIKSAPELLESLNDLLSGYSNLYKIASKSHSVTLNNIESSKIFRALNAIKKATE